MGFGFILYPYWIPRGESHHPPHYLIRISFRVRYFLIRKNLEGAMRYLVFLCLFPLSVVALGQGREIPDECEILEGWVTVWIDQIRQTRDEIIYLKMEGKDPDSELNAKYEYVKYESARFSEAFEQRCDSQGLQAK